MDWMVTCTRRGSMVRSSDRDLTLLIHSLHFPFINTFISLFLFFFFLPYFFLYASFTSLTLFFFFFFKKFILTFSYIVYNVIYIYNSLLDVSDMVCLVFFFYSKKLSEKYRDFFLTYCTTYLTGFPLKILK